MVKNFVGFSNLKVYISLPSAKWLRKFLSRDVNVSRALIYGRVMRVIILSELGDAAENEKCSRNPILA